MGEGKKVNHGKRKKHGGRTSAKKIILPPPHTHLLSLSPSRCLFWTALYLLVRADSSPALTAFLKNV